MPVKKLPALSSLSFHIIHIITQAFLVPLDPQEKEASMDCQVPRGPLDLLDDKERVEHEVCPVQIICIYPDMIQEERA